MQNIIQDLLISHNRYKHLLSNPCLCVFPNPYNSFIIHELKELRMELSVITKPDTTQYLHALDNGKDMRDPMTHAC